MAAAFWSTGGLIIRSLEIQDPWTISFWRAVFAGLVLIGFVAAGERGGIWQAIRQVGLPGMVMGACFGASSVAFVAAVTLTRVANVLVILATAPFWAVLFGKLFHSEPVERRLWGAMFASLTGVALMMVDSRETGTLRGDAVALVMPAAFALATVIIRRRSDMTMIPGMVYSPLLVMLVAAPMSSGLRVSGRDLALLAVFGGIQLGTGMALFAVGARRAPATQVALVALLETVLGPLWVWWWVGERPSDWTLAGGALVMTVIVVNALADLRAETVPVQP